MPLTRIARASSCNRSGSATASTIARPSFPAARSSESRSPARSSASRCCCSATSRPETWTKPRRRWSRRCCWSCTGNRRRFWSWSRTARSWPPGSPFDTSCEMRTFTLLARSLTWYWRTNLAVLLGVAAAAGVLGGALVVGDSVRASLRDLVLARLGNVDWIISRNGYFGEQLGVPLIVIDGVVTHERSGSRAGAVQIYGVDERFWKFQAQPGEPPRGRQALMSAALRRELGANDGDSILIRVEKPSAIPLESLHGRKEDVGKSIRLALRDAPLREFSLRPSQGDVRAVFVPLARLQRDIDAEGKANTVVGSGAPPAAIPYTLDDLGIKVRLLEKQNCLALETDGAVLSDYLAQTAAATAQSSGLHTEPVLTYLANTIRDGGREIPYSVVTALGTVTDGMELNQWAARELNAKPGDTVTLEYYLWQSGGRLVTASASFPLAKIVPAGNDRDYTPEYPGITDSDSLHDWDPPFPIDLKRVRPIDEAYWKQYRTTPKACIQIEEGQRLWQSRYGDRTSVRISPAA